jgi:diguanylate cyclase (GGDEF)-like protein
MSLQTLRALLIDDSRGDADILARLVDEIPEFRFDLTYEPDPCAALEALCAGRFDIVFLDHFLGSVTGLELAQRIRKSGDLTPIVMFTGRGDEDIAIRLGQAGVDAYLSKSCLSREAIRTAILDSQTRHADRIKRAKKERSQEQRAASLEAENRELQHQNRHDPLTGLCNREAWDSAAKIEHARSLRCGHSYAVLMVDVDFFKDFNDAAGHKAGDRCLVQVAAGLSGTSRQMDIVARYGGEEFIVMAPETESNDAVLLGERLRDSVLNMAIPHPASPIAEWVTISCGVASGPADDLENVIESADRGLYAAKASGRNRVCAYKGIGGSDVRRDDKRSYSILFVDDDEADAEILRRMLDEIVKGEFTFRHCSDPDSAHLYLSQGHVNLVLVDYRLNKETGVGAIQGMRACGYEGRIIGITGYGDEYVAAKLIRAGADDYISKKDLSPKKLQELLEDASYSGDRRQLGSNRERSSKDSKRPRDLNGKQLRETHAIDLNHHDFSAAPWVER